MRHDIQAAWATSEIAYLYNQNKSLLFSDRLSEDDWSFYASMESRKIWPITDGVVVAEAMNERPVKVAVEFKRPNEGVHGILTALGQSLAYIEKGYDAAAIVIPKRYETHDSPGEHVLRILNKTNPNAPVSIFTYGVPDTSIATPFRNNIRCIKSTAVGNINNEVEVSTGNYIKTLWMHLREGSSDPDAFFKYCQIAKRLDINSANFIYPVLPDELLEAIEQLSPGADPYKYLSNVVGDNLLDNTWKEFWFSFVFWTDAIPIYTKLDGRYVLNGAKSKILLPDNSGFKSFNVGRTDSLKNRIVTRLNNGELNEYDSWLEYAKKTRERAHSYREDIDSGLLGMGFINSDGRLTDLGYKFVDACERTGNSNGGIAKNIYSSAILNNGQLGAFLYYFYRVSEELFKNDPLAFYSEQNGRRKFEQDAYVSFIENKFKEELYIIRKVSARGGTARKPFQAEFAILRYLGLVKNFRPGVGLEINWPKLQEEMSFLVNI